MGKGVLEVHLVDARGLSGSDFLGACRGHFVLVFFGEFHGE
jgi:hypothetical protein